MLPRTPFALLPAAVALSGFAACTDPTTVPDQPIPAAVEPPVKVSGEEIPDMEKGGPIAPEASASEVPRAEGPQAWTMNWFRAPSINGYPDCVQTDYGRGDIRRVALGSDPHAKFVEQNYVDDGVWVHVERVSYSTGTGLAFVSVSDYDYCIRNYQRTYWRMAAAFASEPRPKLEAVAEAPPAKPHGKILLYPDGTEVRTDGDGTTTRTDPDGAVTVTRASEPSGSDASPPSKSDH